MSTDTVVSTTATATAPDFFLDALASIGRQRTATLALEDDARWIATLISRHPAVHASATLFTGFQVYIGVSCSPERLDDMAPFLREIRDRSGSAIEVRQMPADNRICYSIGEWHVSAWLSKNCTFKQIGTKTVEQPVYEIRCGDVPAEITTAAV